MITSILEFFALGTLGFWLLCTLLSIVFIACIENDNSWFPTCAVVAFAAIYWKSFAVLAIGWPVVIIAALIYVCLGVLWSLFRWTRYVKAKGEEFREKHGNNLTDMARVDLKYAMSASHNKSRIISWIGYWPWSVLWNATGDFFKMLYEGLQGIYKKIADKEMAKFGTITNVRE